MDSRLALVDAAPLFAAADIRDARHDEAVAVLAEVRRRVIPVLVVAEVSYMIGRWLGPKAEARFLRSLNTLDVDAYVSDDWSRISELVGEYADFPLGATDASIVAAGERLGITRIVTFDRRHFLAVRPRHCDAFELLP